MELTEMVTIAMGSVLSNYASKNGVYDPGLTVRQDNEWVSLVHDMANLIEEVTDENKHKVEVIELPMPYVLTMLDALQAIKKHKLYSIMGDAKDTEEHIDIVIEEFLEPIAMSDNIDDIEIVLYD